MVNQAFVVIRVFNIGYRNAGHVQHKLAAKRRAVCQLKVAAFNCHHAAVLTGSFLTKPLYGTGLNICIMGFFLSKRHYRQNSDRKKHFFHGMVFYRFYYFLSVRAVRAKNFSPLHSFLQSLPYAGNSPAPSRTNMGSAPVYSITVEATLPPTPPSITISTRFS